MNAAADTWDRLADALTYPADAPAARQEQFVDAFDLDPACTLDVGWHLFGDRPERGIFLAMLRDDLRRMGIDEHGELPDHLPTLLRLIAREDEGPASELATLVAPAVERVQRRLVERGSPYGAVLEEVVRLLAGVACAGVCSLD
jgi:nitrate reductase delta subunit